MTFLFEYTETASTDDRVKLLGMVYPDLKSEDRKTLSTAREEYWKKDFLAALLRMKDTKEIFSRTMRTTVGL